MRWRNEVVDYAGCLNLKIAGWTGAALKVVEEILGPADGEGPTGVAGDGATGYWALP
jgi:hypothetical protein